MNVAGRLQKLEEQAAPACLCQKNRVVETRDLTHGSWYSLHKPKSVYIDDSVFCEKCGRECKRLIIQIVDQKYVPTDGAMIAFERQKEESIQENA